MEQLYQRDVYGKTLVELGKKYPEIVVLDADLSGSTRTALFAKEFPGRFFNFGVAEQNMAATAAGLASCEKIVFVSTFAMFATGRAWDQIRNSIAYNNLNVKIVASHAGISVGPDGSSHQALEDVALMCAIPNMQVIVPCDGPQTHDAVLTAAESPGPFYIRMGRAKVLTLENKDKFVFGRAQLLNPGDDVTIIACGVMVQEALNAAAILASRKIRARLINMHTLKPIDSQVIIQAARETKGIVVCEEHSVFGGLATLVDAVVAQNTPCRTMHIGIKNRFGQSGEPPELMREYNLTCDDIVTAAEALV